MTIAGDRVESSRTLLTRPVDGECPHEGSGASGDQIEIPVADRTLLLDSLRFIRV
ncbi:hypothetical protein [Streptomyces chiangmaiensis]|uniref:Uncharacterized protein n=1 Tax=Streptomyces chiangmaiensis TaxID=766497 RepID=A0ABU7FHP6_9ACTN|nr:hypothetical protein [Streptomyces chiangmaiensis]MED7823650.1 hypothetical protein [Streptomyces chiangmaiensis]